MADKCGEIPVEPEPGEGFVFWDCSGRIDCRGLGRYSGMGRVLLDKDNSGFFLYRISFMWGKGVVFGEEERASQDREGFIRDYRG